MNVADNEVVEVGVRMTLSFHDRSPAVQVTLTDLRTRLRAGLHWQGKKHHLFYGVTYLSEEFEMQYEGQVVGAIRLDFRF